MCLYHRHTEGVLTFPASLSEEEEETLAQAELEAEEIASHMARKRGKKVKAHVTKGNASLQSFQVFASILQSCTLC